MIDYVGSRFALKCLEVGAERCLFIFGHVEEAIQTLDKARSDRQVHSVRHGSMKMATRPGTTHGAAAIQVGATRAHSVASSCFHI